MNIGISLATVKLGLEPVLGFHACFAELRVMGTKLPCINN